MRVLRQQMLRVQSEWIRAVSGNVLPGMTKAIHDDTYAARLATPEALEFPFDTAGPFQGTVVMLDEKLAQRYEEGYPTFDMKPGLLRGPAAKVSKSGRRYSTIPFTHSTPESTGQKGRPMPAEVYALARGQSYGGPSNPALASLGVRTKNPEQINLEARRRGLAAA